jgi:hypothetical protein
MPAPTPLAAPKLSAAVHAQPVRRSFSLLYVLPLAVLLSPFLLAPLIGRLRALR